MLGTLILTGVGALAFKLGMDAKQMHDEGYSAGDILTSMPCDAKDTLVCAYKKCRDTVCGWFTCSDDEDEDEEETRPSKSSKTKPKKAKKTSKSSKKSAVKVVKPSQGSQTDNSKKS